MKTTVKKLKITTKVHFSILIVFCLGSEIIKIISLLFSHYLCCHSVLTAVYECNVMKGNITKSRRDGHISFVTNAIEFYQAVLAYSSRSCILLSIERLDTDLRIQSNDRAMLFLARMLLVRVGKSIFLFFFL